MSSPHTAFCLMGGRCRRLAWLLIELVWSVQNTQFKKADKKAMGAVFDYLQVCLEQVVKDNELGALQQALEGAYVEPGPGGDPIR